MHNHCVVPENIHTPLPVHGRSLEIPRGRGGGGSKAVISEGWREGFMGNHFSKEWRTTYKALKATHDWSEVQKHTYVRCFEPKVSTPCHWDEVYFISFNVSVFSLSKLALQSPEERCVFGAKSKWFKMADITGVSSSDFQLCLIFVHPTFRCFHFSSLNYYLHMQETHFW